MQYCSRINKFCTIFEAETTAILYTVNLCLNLKLSNSIIASDSLSVISCLKALYVRGNKHTIIYKILQLLLHTNYKISFVWVSAHRGLRGNEFADTSAKATALTGPADGGLCYYWNLYFRFKRDSNVRAFRLLKNTSLNEDKGVKYFQSIKIQTDHSVGGPWFRGLPMLSRGVISTISRLRSGYVQLGMHLSDKNIIVSGLCGCNEDTRSINHIFISCQRTREHSDRLLIELCSLGFDPGTVISLDVAALNALHEFALRASVVLYAQYAKPWLM